MADNKNSGTLLAAGLTCLVGGGIGGGFSLAGAEVPVLDSIALQIPLVLLGILLLFASGQFDRMVLIGISVVGLALPIAHLLADGAGDGDVDGTESGSASPQPRPPSRSLMPTARTYRRRPR